MLKETKLAPVPKFLTAPVREPICLDAGKKEYEVKELEAGVTCYRDYAEALKRRHGGLAEAIKEREVEKK